MIAVWVVSPLPALRAGLRALVSADPQVRVVGASAAFPLEESVAGGNERGDRVVLIVTPGALDEPALRALASMDGPVLLVGDDPETARRLARSLPPGRAWGLLSGGAAPEALLAALAALSEGLVVISADLGGEVLSLKEEGLAPSGDGIGAAEPLTGREAEVLRLVAQGLTNKQIALALGISEHTVKFHLSAIFERLGVSNRAEAVREGARLGWVPL